MSNDAMRKDNTSNPSDESSLGRRLNIEINLRNHTCEKLHYIGEFTLMRNLINAANMTWLS